MGSSGCEGEVVRTSVDVGWHEALDGAPDARWVVVVAERSDRQILKMALRICRLGKARGSWDCGVDDLLVLHHGVTVEPNRAVIADFNQPSTLPRTGVRYAGIHPRISRVGRPSMQPRLILIDEHMVHRWCSVSRSTALILRRESEVRREHQRIIDDTPRAAERSQFVTTSNAAGSSCVDNPCAVCGHNIATLL